MSKLITKRYFKTVLKLVISHIMGLNPHVNLQLFWVSFGLSLLHKPLKNRYNFELEFFREINFMSKLIVKRNFMSITNSFWVSFGLSFLHKPLKNRYNFELEFFREINFMSKLIIKRNFKTVLKLVISHIEGLTPHVNQQLFWVSLGKSREKQKLKICLT